VTYGTPNRIGKASKNGQFLCAAFLRSKADQRGAGDLPSVSGAADVIELGVYTTVTAAPSDMW
jgi:hypothetical protein